MPPLIIRVDHIVREASKPPYRAALGAAPTVRTEKP